MVEAWLAVMPRPVQRADAVGSTLSKEKRPTTGQGRGRNSTKPFRHYAIAHGWSSKTIVQVCASLCTDRCCAFSEIARCPAGPATTTGRGERRRRMPAQDGEEGVWTL